MSDCEVCIGGFDGDYAEIYSDRWFKARKVAKCCECRGEIKPGDRYESVSMRYEGEWLRYRTCAPCHEIREVFTCGKGFMFESLWEDMEEYVFPVLTTATKCFQKLSADSKAFLLDRWQKWKFQNVTQH